MTTQQLINLINLEADELLDTDKDNIPYVNQAIDFLSFFLAGMNDPDMFITTDVADGDNIPASFIDFIPKNGYPIAVNGSKFKIISDDYMIRDVHMTLSKPHVAAMDDNIPFRDSYAGCLVLIASYLIKKKTYIPVEYCEQDKSFITELMGAIKAAKGGAA